MRPSRLVAGGIAGTCGVVASLAFIVWRGDRLFSNGGDVRIIIAIAFGIAYGLFWLADRLGLLADPFTKDSEINDVYPEKPKGDNQQSV